MHHSVSSYKWWQAILDLRMTTFGDCPKGCMGCDLMVLGLYIRCCYLLIRHLQLRTREPTTCNGEKKLKRRQTSFKSGYFKKKATGLRQADDINEVQEAWKSLPLGLHDDAVQWSTDRTIECMLASYWCATDQKLLCPSPSQKPLVEKHAEDKEENDPDRRTYRLLQMRATEMLWNTAIAAHFPPSPCKGMLVWDLDKEV